MLLILYLLIQAFSNCSGSAEVNLRQPCVVVSLQTNLEILFKERNMVNAIIYLEPFTKEKGRGQPAFYCSIEGSRSR
ncbi:hypothetical protein PAHAL_6G149800 [Panicum hallii]|uniref:Secreted protein n=1 Tax=Panicum hallii TaxID=206008 RepID=A0A2T8IGA3_9POAL|nr:hypothetical protein PAHAL_6G149800 [Panicum hallii]